jgi:hypothetical protein
VVLSLSVVVDGSTIAANPAGFGGRTVDASARQQTEENRVDESHHLAKVRVAGSNAVFCSREVPALGDVSAA